jgi:hypothetical protein
MLAVFVAGDALAQSPDLNAVLAAAEEESSPVIRQALQTAKGAEIRIEYRAVKSDRKITDSLKSDAEIRSHFNKNYLWKLAETQTNASLYSEGISIPAGKFWLGFITTGYDWYVVLTNEQGQRIVEELVSVLGSDVSVSRLVMSIEPGDGSNDAVLVVRYGTGVVRLPFTIGDPVSAGSGSRAK